MNNAKETMVIVPLSLWLDLCLRETSGLRPLKGLVFVACQEEKVKATASVLLQGLGGDLIDRQQILHT